MFFFADTHCLEEIDADMLPEWKDKKVPEIAKYYWKMKQASHSGHHSSTHAVLQMHGSSAEVPCRILAVSEKVLAFQPRFHAGFLLCQMFWHLS